VAQYEPHVIFGGLFGADLTWRKGPFLGDNANFGEGQLARKETCEGKPQAKEESMQGVHARKPNHVRVSIFVRDCNH
jgi:hypothetical protein